VVSVSDRDELFTVAIVVALALIAVVAVAVDWSSG
jgi:hypothetical protein